MHHKMGGQIVNMLSLRTLLTLQMFSVVGIFVAVMWTHASALPITSKPLDSADDNLEWHVWVTLSQQEHEHGADKARKVKPKSIFILPNRAAGVDAETNGYGGGGGAIYPPLNCLTGQHQFESRCIPTVNIDQQNLLLQELQALLDQGNIKHNNNNNNNNNNSNNNNNNSPNNNNNYDYDYDYNYEAPTVWNNDDGPMPSRTATSNATPSHVAHSDGVIPASDDVPLRFNIFHDNYPTDVVSDDEIAAVRPQPAAGATRSDAHIIAAPQKSSTPSMTSPQASNITANGLDTVVLSTAMANSERRPSINASRDYVDAEVVAELSEQANVQDIDALLRAESLLPMAPVNATGASLVGATITIDTNTAATPVATDATETTTFPTQFVALLDEIRANANKDLLSKEEWTRSVEDIAAMPTMLSQDVVLQSTATTFEVTSSGPLESTSLSLASSSLASSSSSSAVTTPTSATTLGVDEEIEATTTNANNLETQRPRDADAATLMLANDVRVEQRTMPSAMEQQKSKVEPVALLLPAVVATVDSDNTKTTARMTPLPTLLTANSAGWQDPDNDADQDHNHDADRFRYQDDEMPQVHVDNVEKEVAGSTAAIRRQDIAVATTTATTTINSERDLHAIKAGNTSSDEEATIIILPTMESLRLDMNMSEATTLATLVTATATSTPTPTPPSTTTPTAFPLDVEENRTSGVVDEESGNPPATESTIDHEETTTYGWQQELAANTAPARQIPATTMNVVVVVDASTSATTRARSKLTSSLATPASGGDPRVGRSRIVKRVDGNIEHATTTATTISGGQISQRNAGAGHDDIVTMTTRTTSRPSSFWWQQTEERSNGGGTANGGRQSLLAQFLSLFLGN